VTDHLATIGTETAALDSLKPHPRNYRTHPAEQIEHLKRSLVEHGQYRNIVIARDGTILAGHGVYEAARLLGWQALEVKRLTLAPNDPMALKVMAADNTLQHFAEQDDRALSELLREIGQATDAGLLGTGFDEGMLANLVYVTRHSDEIENIDEAAQWVGMPEYDPMAKPLTVMVYFRSQDDLVRFMEILDVPKLQRDGTATSKTMWWPPKTANDDVNSVRFQPKAAPS
jgi:hypothetical protein